MASIRRVRPAPWGGSSCWTCRAKAFLARGADSPAPKAAVHGHSVQDRTVKRHAAASCFATCLPPHALFVADFEGRQRIEGVRPGLEHRPVPKRRRARAANRQGHIDSGRYASVSDHVRDLIRRDQAIADQRARLVEALIEGEESSVSTRQVTDIVNALRQEVRGQGT